MSKKRKTKASASRKVPIHLEDWEVIYASCKNLRGKELTEEEKVRNRASALKGANSPENRELARRTGEAAAKALREVAKEAIAEEKARKRGLTEAEKARNRAEADRRARSPEHLAAVDRMVKGMVENLRAVGRAAEAEEAAQKKSTKIRSKRHRIESRE